MKKSLAILLCVFLALTLSACKQDRFEDEEVIFSVSDNILPDQSQPEADSSSQETDSSSQEGDVSEEGKPQGEKGNDSPESELIFEPAINIVDAENITASDINKRYELASKIYYEITSNTVPVDWDLGRKEIKVNDSYDTYFRVNDPRFDSVAELEEYLNTLFTPEFIKTFYKAKNFTDYEGHLYAVSGTGADDVLYAGHTFKVTKQTTMRVFFTAEVYRFKSLEQRPAEVVPFYTVPEDASAYDVTTVDFVYEITEDGETWKFSKFGNIVY